MEVTFGINWADQNTLTNQSGWRHRRAERTRQPPSEISARSAMPGLPQLFNAGRQSVRDHPEHQLGRKQRTGQTPRTTRSRAGGRSPRVTTSTTCRSTSRRFKGQPQPEVRHVLRVHAAAGIAPVELNGSLQLQREQQQTRSTALRAGQPAAGQREPVYSELDSASWTRKRRGRFTQFEFFARTTGCITRNFTLDYGSLGSTTPARLYVAGQQIATFDPAAFHRIERGQALSGRCARTARATCYGNQPCRLSIPAGGFLPSFLHRQDHPGLRVR